MLYVSTRGKAPELDFEQILLSGLADDGGLYVPKYWPQLEPDLLRAFQTMPYCDIAVEVILPYVGHSLSRDSLTRLVHRAYSGFTHAAVVPLKQLDNRLWLMELFHGPTLAFKDLALQLIGLLFDDILTRRGKRITIVGATSGDTGAAAIEACRNCEHVDIFILHPHGRVSEVQRRQMTTVDAGNVYNIAIEGTFDDCQRLVKAMFADSDFCKELNLTAVNSINWGRIMAQIVYYVTAAARLGAPERSIDVVVPTGNFGNLYAAHAAKSMGVPIRSLGLSTNQNDILSRFINNNDMSVKRVEPSLSPSMDIQVSSNFERFLFDLIARDGERVDSIMRTFHESGVMRPGPDVWNLMSGSLVAKSSSDEATLAEITFAYEAYGEILDPHTATGLSLARSGALARSRALARSTGTDRGRGRGELPAETGEEKMPVVLMATAHPAKFLDVIQMATGIHPELPNALSDLYSRQEKFRLEKSDLASIKSFIRQSSI